MKNFTTHQGGHHGNEKMESLELIATEHFQVQTKKITALI